MLERGCILGQSIYGGGVFMDEKENENCRIWKKFNLRMKKI
jgi:hypothetical protein